MYARETWSRGFLLKVHKPFFSLSAFIFFTFEPFFWIFLYITFLPKKFINNKTKGAHTILLAVNDMVNISVYVKCAPTYTNYNLLIFCFSIYSRFRPTEYVSFNKNQVHSSRYRWHCCCFYRYSCCVFGYVSSTIVDFYIISNNGLNEKCFSSLVFHIIKIRNSFLFGSFSSSFSFPHLPELLRFVVCG